MIHWTLDPMTGHINAFDDEGRKLMTIPTDPQYGERLAAAFRTPAERAAPLPPRVGFQPYRLQAQAPLSRA
jgi:hypothetical protein